MSISSRATAFAALQLGKHPENKIKLIVAILPDTDGRYLSNTLFQEEQIVICARQYGKS